MIKNYLKIAFRNLWKTKGFSAINIIGLSVGMTACFLIALYVRFELSYDTYHSKADRIYRLATDVKTPSDVLHTALTSGPMGIYMAKDFPEVENYTRVLENSFLVRKDNLKFQEHHILMADSTLLNLFDFQVLAGDHTSPLTAPLSLVLSESAAKKYFGKEDPIGKTLLLTDESFPAKVSAVIRDIPENSQLKADIFLSLSTLKTTFKQSLDDQWGNFGFISFMLLKANTQPATLTRKFPAFIDKYAGKFLKDSKMSYTLSLEPLKDIYLRSDRTETFQSGNIHNVYIFAIVAVFILLIACINFINLSTARALERAKEVGLRKVVGAYRSQVMTQFLSESILICLCSFVITIALCLLLVPYFNGIVGKEISKGLFHQPGYIGVLFILSVFIGLLAGVYPAMVLSSFNPVTVLKGKFSSNSKGLLLRQSLVILQFVVSIALISGTLIINKQLNFMRSQDLGFSKEQTLVLQTNEDPKGKILKDAVIGLSGVLSSSRSSTIPGSKDNAIAYSEIENRQGDMQVCSLPVHFVDYDYIPQYQMNVIAGRSFSPEFGTDTANAMIINETAVKLLGYSDPKEAIGKKYAQWGSNGQIIGVVKDFHFKSLQSAIEPLSMRIVQGGGDFISIKIDGKQIDQTIKAVQQKWDELIPNRPFNFFFADEAFNKQYQTEHRFGRVFINFSVLAILISCLGLFGLVSYNTTQRFREIGVRKILGSSINAIIRLLSVDFIKLVVIAFFIATPITWFFMRKWLNNFAYHTSLDAWIFILAGSLSLIIALLVVCTLTIKAAQQNPIRSLREE